LIRRFTNVVGTANADVWCCGVPRNSASPMPMPTALLRIGRWWRLRYGAQTMRRPRPARTSAQPRDVTLRIDRTAPSRNTDRRATRGSR